MFTEGVVLYVPPDADFFTIWVAQGAIGVLGIGSSPIAKFRHRLVVGMSSKQVAPFSTEDAASEGRGLAAALPKGGGGGGGIRCGQRVRMISRRKH